MLKLKKLYNIFQVSRIYFMIFYYFSINL